MTKFRMLIPAWFRSAPLLLTMLALMAGIVGMHAWTGGLGTTAPAAAPEHGAVILHDGGTEINADAPMSVPAHEGHDSQSGVAMPSHSGAAIPALETTSGATSLPLESNADCSEGCGGMTMLNCVLAFALLVLTVLIRPALPTLPGLVSHFRPVPLLLRTAAPVRGPSLIHLSISRT